MEIESWLLKTRKYAVFSLGCVRDNLHHSYGSNDVKMINITAYIMSTKFLKPAFFTKPWPRVDMEVVKLFQCKSYWKVCIQAKYLYNTNADTCIM
jgi:hypothetical protein